jgi:hypothetical protein
MMHLMLDVVERARLPQGGQKRRADSLAEVELVEAVAVVVSGFRAADSRSQAVEEDFHVGLKSAAVALSLF